MEQIKIKKETFNKIAEFKKQNPDCKNLDDALTQMLSDLENNLKIETEEKKRFQNGLHDKNKELEQAKQALNAQIEKGSNGTAEQTKEIERLNNMLELVQNDLDAAMEIRDNLQAENDSLIAKISTFKENEASNDVYVMQWEQKFNQQEQQIKDLTEKLKQTDSVKNSVSLLDPTQKILDLVSQRLTERYGQPITANDIVNKMVLRYVVERYTEWFFPLKTISVKEIENITGKTESELLQFLNGK